MKLNLIPLMMVASASVALGQTYNLNINATQTGWVDSDGNGDTANTNYISGFYGGVEYRNYFSFDLSGVVGDVVSATLSVSQGSTGYSSADSSEIILFTNVTDSVPATGSIADPALFSGLGSGATFGAAAVSASDTSVDVILNSNFVSAANSSASTIVLGGTLVSGDTTSDSYVFGYSHEGTGVATLNLVVDASGGAVPEPSSVLLLSLAGVGVIARRKR